MYKNLTTFLLLFLPFCLIAQFTDDFSDVDFTNNPTWTGNTDKFIIENQILRLNDNQAGQAFLATQNSFINNTQWEFWVRLAFTPSNNNHPRIYLVSNLDNLSGPVNGYYIQIGKDGTNNKRLFFYRQTGNISVLLMTGAHNIAATTNNILRIKVTRDNLGNWKFFADPSGGIAYVEQGNVSDTGHTSTQWFGVFCRYTVSNANRFYFDDFYVGEIIVDTIPPLVTKVVATSSKNLEVYFSEPLETQSAQNPGNFQVDKGIGIPQSVVLAPGSPDKVVLAFDGIFEIGELYNLSIANIQDLAGNLMDNFTGSFTWYVPVKFDIVFNELMADPTPVVGLPDFEYVELYNTSAFDINITGWTLQHGTTQRVIPPAQISSGGYLVLCHPDAINELSEFGNVVAVPGLSTTALLNDGTTLVLFDDQMEMISWVNYNESWYNDPSKSGGGWALEKIDPYNFCAGSTNWTASRNESGGTPGKPNSVLGNNPDLNQPVLLRAGWEANNRISLFFDEPMNVGDLSDPLNYFINNGNPQSVVVFAPEFKRVDLVLNNPLSEGTLYEVSVAQNVTDCAGNLLARNMARVAVPVAPDSLDLVINEVLFNPPDHGVRYIEIYNRSTRVIDMQNLIIASRDTIINVFTTIRHISNESHLVFPGDYMVFTPDPEIVKSQYMTNNPWGFIQTDMPSMTNTSGILVLATKGQRIIDQFIYTEDMHYPLLTNKKGVALERLNYHRPTQDRSNWHSAAHNVGFGTPGFKNSQFTLDPGSQEEVIKIYPKIFSPDNDGVDDVLNISCKFDMPGYTANINIYDSRGRLVRILKRSELLSTKGVVTWDGTNSNNLKAPMGIYIIFIETFNPSGVVKTYRRTVVLGGRL